MSNKQEIKIVLVGSAFDKSDNNPNLNRVLGILFQERLQRAQSKAEILMVDYFSNLTVKQK